jgi:hypothetical protein
MPFRVINLDKAIRIRVAKDNKLSLVSYVNFSDLSTVGDSISIVRDSRRARTLLNSLFGCCSSDTCKYRHICSSCFNGHSAVIAETGSGVSPLSEKVHLRWECPTWARGFMWSPHVASCSPSATSTESADPFPCVPDSILRSPVAVQTIRENPSSFFKVICNSY